jgi:alanine racemase
MPNEALLYAKKITDTNNLELEGVFSHFASSEDDLKYSKKQEDTFKKTIDELEKNNIHITIKHFACSAATIFLKTAHFNAVRLGLGLYGLYPNENSKKIVKLKPALRLNTKIIQIKTIGPNTKIGYGGTYITKKQSKIAILPIGYWDGLDRKLSNTGQVIVKGIKCPIRGRICMNLMMIDVTKIKRVQVGDEVVIIGKQGQSEIGVDELAKQIGTINYEVVDRINPLLPRIVI